MAQQQPLFHPSVQLSYFSESNATLIFIQAEENSWGHRVPLQSHTPTIGNQHLKALKSVPNTFNYYSLLSVSEVTQAEYLKQSIVDKEHGMCVSYREHSVKV